MKTSNTVNVLRSTVLCLSLAALYACRAGFTTNDDTVNDPDFWRFTGAGSNWRLEMERNGNEFELTRSNNPDSSVNITLTGTYEAFNNNGFTRLTVNDQEGTSSANDEITLVRASNYAAFLSPIFPNDDDVLAMVAVANCGSSDTISNWIRFKHPITNQSSADEPNDFGTLRYVDSTATLTLNARYNLDTPTQNIGNVEIASGECTEGFITESSEHTHYLGSGSSALLDLYNDDDDENQRLFALDQTVVAANTDFDSDSYGLMYDRGASGDNNFPIRADCTSGTCTINQISDIENGDTSGQSYTLELSDVNTPSNGFITGNISLENGNENETAICVLRLGSANQDILACVANSPNNSNQTLNIFLVR